MLQAAPKNRIVEAFSATVGVLLISLAAPSRAADTPPEASTAAEEPTVSVLSAESAATELDAAEAPIWEEIVRDDGVIVSQKVSNGSDFPTFRGRVTIPASPYEVLVVLRDVSRHTEWMNRCVEARHLEETDPLHYIVYNRTESGWPAADRDVILDSVVELDPLGKDIWVRFRALDSDLVPEQDDAVRMKLLDGYYHLVEGVNQDTHVEYLVSVDPGGSLPRWLIHRRMRDLPLATLVRLREQVATTQGEYAEQIDSWKHQTAQSETPPAVAAPPIP